MQAGRRLIENEQRLAPSRVGSTEMLHEFEPLRFPAAQDVQRLPEPQVAQADFLQDRQRLRRARFSPEFFGKIRSPP